VTHSKVAEFRKDVLGPSWLFEQTMEMFPVLPSIFAQTMAKQLIEPAARSKESKWVYSRGRERVVHNFPTALPMEEFCKRPCLKMGDVRISNSQ
jgi:hypothetical protein